MLFLYENKVHLKLTIYNKVTSRMECQAKFYRPFNYMKMYWKTIVVFPLTRVQYKVWLGDIYKGREQRLQFFWDGPNSTTNLSREKER